MKLAANQNDSTNNALRRTLATVAIAVPALAVAILMQGPTSISAAGAQALFGVIIAAGLLGSAAMDWRRSRRAVR